MSDKDHVYLFVYGTLKRGFPLNDWLADSELVGTGVIFNHALISLGVFPALIALPDYDSRKGGVTVDGEVYLVPSSTFKRLRHMEERVGYSISTVDVDLDGMPMLEAKTLLFASIPSGQYSWAHGEDGTFTISVLPD